jgi:SAM-dependent methyltransferase
MTNQENSHFKRIYDKAGRPDKLPWNHTDPTPFLPEAAASRQPARALDIGCGSGVDSVYLASQGWDVTSLDFTPDAIEMTNNRAEEAGVTVSTVRANVLEWSCLDSFDLIVDAGCLHNMAMTPELRLAYRQQVLSWLAEEGDYVLVHFEKRHPFDWRPIGPKRIRRTEIDEFFAPDMKEHDFRRRTMTRQSIMMGPTFAIGHYWFKRIS